MSPQTIYKGMKIFESDLKENVNLLSKIIEDYEIQNNDETEYFVDQLKDMERKFVANMGALNLLQTLFLRLIQPETTIRIDAQEQLEKLTKEEDQESEEQDE